MPRLFNISQLLNRDVLGATDGTSISDNCASGLNAFLPGLTHDQAKDVAHTFMVAAPLLKPATAQKVALGLGFAYVIGRFFR